MRLMHVAGRVTVCMVMLSALLVSAGCATCCRTGTSTAAAPLPNLHQVDAGLYRGGQPTAEGFRRLADLGVKTIVSLRAYGRAARHEHTERRLVESLGMRWVSLPMRMYWRPSDEQVRTFLSLTQAGADGPVFVHCQHGEDRTGSLIAVYRVFRQGWTPAQAYAEALKLGMAAWNPFTRNLIRSTEPAAPGPVASAPH